VTGSWYNEEEWVEVKPPRMSRAKMRKARDFNEDTLQITGIPTGQVAEQHLE
jgi:hypothetical protein